MCTCGDPILNCQIYIHQYLQWWFGTLAAKFNSHQYFWLYDIHAVLDHILQSRYEFEQQLLRKIEEMNTTFNTPVDLSLASQAQFYFDALWAGVLGLTNTLGQSYMDLVVTYACVHARTVFSPGPFSIEAPMPSVGSVHVHVHTQPSIEN